MYIDNEKLINILKTAQSNNKNDEREILDHYINIIEGNEMGVVLSSIDKKNYEVFLHARINKEVISQILFSSYNNVDDAYDRFNYYKNLLESSNITPIIELIETAR